MQDGIFSNLHPATKLLFSIFMIIITFIAFFIGGMLIAMFFFHISLSDIQSISSGFDNIPFLKYLQTLQAISLFIIPSIIIAYFFNRKWYNYLSLDKGTNIFSIAIVVLIVFISLPFINFLAEINSKLNLPAFLDGIEQWMKNSEKEATVLTEKFLTVNTLSGLLFNIFMIGILPAIGEEFLFRGILQKIFTDWTKNVHAGIIISAFIFSAFHLQFYGFLPRMLLGMMFGYFLVWSGSMWLPVIAHFVNNTMAVITYYFVTKGNLNQEVEKIGSENNTYIYAIISFISVSLLLFYLYKYEKKLNLNL